jgi:metaxin
MIELYSWGPGFNRSSLDPYCLSIETLLKFHSIKWQIITTTSEKSPSQQLPLLKIGNEPITGTQNIIQTLKNRGHNLDESLTKKQKAISDAFISMIEYDLGNAWFYCLYMETENYLNFTKGNQVVNEYIFNRQFKDRVGIRLNQFNFKSTILEFNQPHTPEKISEKLEMVYQRARKCYLALSLFLEKKEFMNGNSLTTLDAVAYGHLALHLYPSFKIPRLFSILSFEFPDLIDYVQRIHQLVASIEVEKSRNQQLTWKEWRQEVWKNPGLIVSRMENFGYVERTGDERVARFYNGLAVVGAVAFFSLFVIKSRNLGPTKLLHFI